MKPFFTEADADDTLHFCRVIRLAKANRLINGQSMTGWICKDANEVMTMHMAQPADATHTFQYFNIEPIEQDSAEKIVRDLAELCQGESVEKIMDIWHRAKALLAKGEK